MKHPEMEGGGVGGPATDGQTDHQTDDITVTSRVAPCEQHATRD